MQNSHSIQILALERFIKSSKRLFKKYKNIASDIQELEASLYEDPKLGVSLGGGIYKIRIANSSKNSGKRGGFRVITYFLDKNNTVYLADIYDKSDIESIPLLELRKIFKDL